MQLTRNQRVENDDLHSITNGFKTTTLINSVTKGLKRRLTLRNKKLENGELNSVTKRLKMAT